MDVKGRRADEKAAMEAVAGELADVEGQLARHLDQGRVVAHAVEVRVRHVREAGQEIVDRVRVGRLAALLPGPAYRVAHHVQLGVVAAVRVRVGVGHLGEHRGHRLQLLLRLLDVGEGVEADRGAGLEVQVAGAEHAGDLLVRAADVDDPHEGAAGVVVVGQVVDQKRLARTGGGAADDVVVGRALGKEVERDQLALAADKEQFGRAAGASKVALHRQQRRDRGHRGDEVPLQVVDVAATGIQAERQGREEEDFQNEGVLLHDIAVVLPQPPRPGAGLPRPLQVLVPDEQDGDDADEPDPVFQGVGGLQVLLLLAPQQRRERADGLLVEQQVALGVDFRLQSLLEEEVQGVEEPGLDLVHVRDQAPDAAEQRVGLQRVDLGRDGLGRGAAEVVRAHLQVVAPVADARVRVEDLLAQRQGLVVGGEVLFRVAVRVVVEQPPRPFEQRLRPQGPGREQGRPEGLGQLPPDVLERLGPVAVRELLGPGHLRAVAGQLDRHEQAEVAHRDVAAGGEPAPARVHEADDLLGAGADDDVVHGSALAVAGEDRADVAVRMKDELQHAPLGQAGAEQPLQ